MTSPSSAAVSTPWRTGKAAQDTHYYLPDGSPFYSVPNKSKPGEFRPATLRDARPVGAYPGYSETQNGVAKPGLIKWQREQDVLAVLTSPRLTDYIAGKCPEAEFLAHCYESAHEQAAKAAARGTEGHEAIACHFGGASPGDWLPTCEAIASWMEEDELGNGLPEVAFASKRYGYGGKVDWHNDVAVVDWKGKDGPMLGGAKQAAGFAYEDHCRQLAAYDVGLRDADAPSRALFNVFFSRTHPGHICVHRWSMPEARREFERFKCHLRDWKLARNYWPGEETTKPR